MTLTTITVKVDPNELELAKLNGANVSALTRDAISIYNNVKKGGRETLKDRLVEIEVQQHKLNLEKEIIIQQLQDIYSNDAIEENRENQYRKYKENLSFQVINKTIDWKRNSLLFDFKSPNEFKKWLYKKLEEDCLLPNL